MNRLLGKLFTELPKEVCWEGAVSEQTGDLSSPTSRTFKHFQLKTLAKPKAQNPEIRKYESALEVKKKKQNYYSSSKIQTGKSGKHNSSFEATRKQDEYDSWLNRRSSLVDEDPHGKKPCTPLVLHQEPTPRRQTHSVITATPTATYLPPRLIPDPEVALRPSVRETLVSITDQTPPSLQKWAQQLDIGEQDGWLKEFDAIQQSDEPDADIKILQKALAEEKKELKKNLEWETTRKEEPKVRAAVETKKNDKKEPVNFTSKNPLERCLAQRLLSQKSKRDREPIGSEENSEADPVSFLERKPVKITGSKTPEVKLSPTKIEQDVMKSKKPSQTSIKRRFSPTDVQSSNTGFYQEKYKLNSSSTTSSPVKKNSLTKKLSKPRTDQSANDSSLSPEATAVDEPGPAHKYSCSTRQQLSTSYCQQFLSQSKAKPQPLSEDFLAKLDAPLRAFELDEKNLKIFKQLIESEEKWAHHKGSTSVFGSIAELSEGQDIMPF